MSAQKACVVAVVRDVMQRKRIEEALRQSEERFRLLIEGARDYAIFMLDLEGRVVTWNPGAERIKGYRADEIIGCHFSIFYPQEDVDRKLPQHELGIVRKEGGYEDEGWRVRKDGSRFWANVVISADTSRITPAAVYDTLVNLRTRGGVQVWVGTASPGVTAPAELTE